MVEAEPWYLTERAKQLAIVYLSRREDLVIRQESAATDSGVDLLVSLTKAGNYTGRVFGVQVKGLQSYKKIRRAPDSGNLVFDLKQWRFPLELPFPLCLFIFVMEDDTGYYTWLKPPTSNFGKQTSLRFQTTKELKPLATKVIDQMVAEVAEWYESRVKIPA